MRRRTQKPGRNWVTVRWVDGVAASPDLPGPRDSPGACLRGSHRDRNGISGNLVTDGLQTARAKQNPVHSDSTGSGCPRLALGGDSLVEFPKASTGPGSRDPGPGFEFSTSPGFRFQRETFGEVILKRAVAVGHQQQKIRGGVLIQLAQLGFLSLHDFALGCSIPTHHNIRQCH